MVANVMAIIKKLMLKLKSIMTSDIGHNKINFNKHLSYLDYTLMLGSTTKLYVTGPANYTSS